VLLARFAYSLNWFLTSPVLPVIANEGGIPLWMLGLVPLAFFISTGICQIPAGFVSNRLGATKTYVLGLVVLSLGNLVLPLSPNVTWLLLTRALAGVGAALFFASAGGVLLGLYPEKPGLIMGLYNVAFALGGGGGLLWGVLEQAYGWRFGVALGGGLGLIIAALNLALVGSIAVKGKYDIGQALKLFSDKTLVLGAVSFVGVWGAYFAVGQLLPTYQQTVLAQTTGQSGIGSSPLLFASILGGLSSLLYDKTSHRKRLLFVAGVGAVLPIALFPVAGGSLILPSLLVLGFFNELAISMFYAFANNRAPEKAAASLALVNMVQVLLGMWMSPLLSVLSQAFSWNLGWTVVGIGSLIPLLFLIKVRIK
jgi:MFS family permease